MSPVSLTVVATVRRCDGMFTCSEPLIDRGLKYLSESGRSPSPFPKNKVGLKVLILSATLAGPIPPTSALNPELKMASCSALLKKTYFRPNSGLPAPELRGPLVGSSNR